MCLGAALVNSTPTRPVANYHGLSARHFCQRSCAFFLELVLHMGDRQEHENTVAALFGKLFGACHAGRLTPAQVLLQSYPPPPYWHAYASGRHWAGHRSICLCSMCIWQRRCAEPPLSRYPFVGCAAAVGGCAQGKTSRAGGVSSGVLAVC
jgi:hypothetical protein